MISPNYEIIRYKQGLSANMVVHSVNRIKLHWHKELELLLVLRGSVTLVAGGKSYLLQEDDLFLVNSNEIHSTMANGDNIMAAIQINPDFCHTTYPELRDCTFHCVSLGQSEDEPQVFSQLRTCVARIIMEYNKSGDGYQLAIEALLNTILSLILRSLPVTRGNGAERTGNDKDLQRIKRIMDYVQEHYAEKITLDDIAKSEYLSTFYLSHFFKEKVGFSFQKYLNFVRLHMAVVALDSTDQLIGDIALDTGFAGVKSFNKVFGEFYQKTPSEYRRKHAPGLPELSDGADYMEFDSIKAVEKLQEYLSLPITNVILQSHHTTRAVTVAVGSPAQPLPHYWRRVMTVGRAYDCLREDLQGQLATAARELKFQTVRFHGIFSDEMRIFGGRSGDYQWQYVDKVVDFLVSIGLCPFFDLTFMPTAIASDPAATLFWYKGNISMPRSITLWTDLVGAFVRHLLGRYGAEQVRGWYFEVWNEPDYVWGGTQQQYLEFFQATAQTLLACDPALRIAGPSILQPMDGDTSWLDRMVDFLNERELELPCFTYHFYGESNMQQNASSGTIPILGGADYLRDCAELFSQSLARLHKPVREVLLTEFNISAQHGNPLLDTMFPACYILRCALGNRNRLDGLGFWTISDIFEEDAAVAAPFGGGFGMMTAEGIKKPSYYAYQLLSMLGNELIYEEEGLVVTRCGDSYQALGYNFVFYDKLFCSGDRTLLTDQHRYGVFEEKPAVDLTLTLQGVTGCYRVTRRRLDREHGSAFDCYQRMGAPARLTADEAEYLRQVSAPQLETATVSLTGSYSENLLLPPHGIVLVTLDRVWD